MSQVNVTLSFANAAEAAAALSLLSGNVSAAPTARTSRTAEAGKGDVQETKAESSVKNETKAESKKTESKKAETIDAADFKAKVVDGALMPYSKKVDKDTFGKTMAKFGCKSVKDVEAKPEIWVELVAICHEALNG